MPKINSLHDVFKNVKVDDNGCWIWQGSKDRDGYGLVWHGGRRWQAHIFFWVQHRGEYAPELELDHSCRNRACVNWLTHLELVTKEENLRRRQWKKDVEP